MPTSVNARAPKRRKISAIPKISVVVPSYNQGRFLSECLESIVAQAYPNLELIVMDGGSTDESVEIIKSYEKHIAYWQSQKDGGQSAAINAGVSRATGEIVAWLNSDDFYYPYALWHVASAWKKHPGAALYIGNGSRFDDDAKLPRPFHRRNIAFTRRSIEQGLDYVQQPSMFFNRAIWAKIGGLDPRLNFCMDWDIIIRMAKAGNVVTLNEFLSFSREYMDTKTAQGGLDRAEEIRRMIQSHTGQLMTVGSIMYALEYLVQSHVSGVLAPPIQSAVWEAYLRARQTLPEATGTSDGWPEVSDPQDIQYVAVPRPDSILAGAFKRKKWPKISIVVPSFNQARYLERTLASLFDQNYPNLEVFVMDGGSTDDSVSIIRRYSDRLAFWCSEKDKGPADAINRGFARATGDILGWLNSDDMLTDGALFLVAEAFLKDATTRFVIGNAVYIDESDQPIVMDHGLYKTAYYYGDPKPREQVPAFWEYVHSIPQPATFFAKELLSSAGPLDESYKFIFDFELFFRFSAFAKPVKLETTLAFYRIHAEAKTSGWQNFLVELYRFSRAWWPSPEDPDFERISNGYLNAFLGRAWGGRPRDERFERWRAFFADMIRVQSDNPEQFLLRHPDGIVFDGEPGADTKVSGELVAAPPAQHTKDYSVVFSSYFLPRFPGKSGGEIRDYFLIQKLLEFSDMSFYSPHSNPGKDQEEVLQGALRAYWDLARMMQELPQDVDMQYLLPPSNGGKKDHVLSRLFLTHDVKVQARFMKAGISKLMEKELGQSHPDFFIASPQTNSVAMLLADTSPETRFVLATYDVEQVRLSRLGKSKKGMERLAGLFEQRKGCWFEQKNLALYDGVIAVSELDREIFIHVYGINPDRVCTIENGVDTHYFAYADRRTDVPPSVVFVASFGYPPNEQAALRLIDEVMPRVWAKRPDAQLKLVGQQPSEHMRARSADERIIVTGEVPDVRAYLNEGAVMCAPLTAGSGTKYKVLEALSCGIPVVCTRLAAEGLAIASGEHAWIHDSNDDLAASVVEALDGSDRIRQAAARGREFVCQHHDWSAVLKKLKPFLDQLKSMPITRKTSVEGSIIQRLLDD